MAKAKKSGDRSAKNGKANVKSNTRSRKTESDMAFDLLDPEQWIRFGEAYRLSERELEIVVLTSRDLSRKMIAHELPIAFDTVDKLCDRLHKKTGVTSRVGLLRLLLQFARSAEPS